MNVFRKVEPDANCITTADGGCVGGTMAGKAPCMHDAPVFTFPEGTVANSDGSVTVPGAEPLRASR